MVDSTAPVPLLLMTPGPTRVPERVLRAGSRPMIHHRTPEFSSELAAAIELLKPVFGTTNLPLPVHTTGRGALEATICNLFSAGDQIAVCCDAKFGEMWAKFAESYGVHVHRWATSWEHAANASELAALFDEHPRVRAIAIVYGDTSTGVANDVAAVAQVAARHGALVLVNAISSLGGMKFDFDAWGVDAAVTASQKCLMSAPSLAWVALSDRARLATSTACLPRNSWDFADIHRSVATARRFFPPNPVWMRAPASSTSRVKGSAIRSLLSVAAYCRATS